MLIRIYEDSHSLKLIQSIRDLTSEMGKSVEVTGSSPVPPGFASPAFEIDGEVLWNGSVPDVSWFQGIIGNAPSLAKRWAAALAGDWPKTLGEAVVTLIEAMNEETTQKLKKTPKGELSAFHSSLGMSIRNAFGFYRGNTALLESCGVDDADSASGVIIDSAWSKLTGVNQHAGQSGSGQVVSTKGDKIVPIINVSMESGASGLWQLSEAYMKLLAKYIESQNQIFDGSAKGLFTANDFAFHVEQLTKQLSLAEEFIDFGQNVSESKNWTRANTGFLEGFGKYASAVRDSMVLLVGVTEKLRRKALGEKYGFFEYRKDMKSFQESVLRFRGEGTRMNRLLENIDEVAIPPESGTGQASTASEGHGTALMPITNIAMAPGAMGVTQLRIAFEQVTIAFVDSIQTAYGDGQSWPSQTPETIAAVRKQHSLANEFHEFLDRVLDQRGPKERTYLIVYRGYVKAIGKAANQFIYLLECQAKRARGEDVSDALLIGYYQRWEEAIDYAQGLEEKHESIWQAHRDKMD